MHEKGWVGADDTLRLAVHLRVRNGRSRCPEAPSHSLAVADPRRTYARYGGAWHCDVCGGSGKAGEPMYHCTHGCEFDLCGKCRVRSTALLSLALPFSPWHCADLCGKCRVRSTALLSLALCPPLAHHFLPHVTVESGADVLAAVGAA